MPAGQRYRIVRGVRRTACAVEFCGDWSGYSCAICGRALCERHARIQPGKRGADGGLLCHYCPEHDKERRP